MHAARKMEGSEGSRDSIPGRSDSRTDVQSGKMPCDGGREMRIPLPREHGTWAMLYAPVVCAVFAVRHVSIPFFFFLISLTAAFFARDPIESFLRIRKTQNSDTGRLRFFRKWIAIYSALAILPAGILIFLYHLWFFA